MDVQLRKLLGRSRELSDVILAVSRGDECVVITGPPGAGKTLLMAHVAAALADTPGSWIDLRQARDRVSVDIAIGMAVLDRRLTMSHRLLAGSRARRPSVALCVRSGGWPEGASPSLDLRRRARSCAR